MFLWISSCAECNVPKAIGEKRNLKADSNSDDCVVPASAHPPGTTPLVAMALIEMAVNMVCAEREGR